jgi:hypothetical protein
MRAWTQNLGRLEGREGGKPCAQDGAGGEVANMLGGGMASEGAEMWATRWSKARVENAAPRLR